MVNARRSPSTPSSARASHWHRLRLPCTGSRSLNAAVETPVPVFEPLQCCPCDCSETALRWALQRLGPSCFYVLSVYPDRFLETSNYVRLWTNAPLALQINVEEDAALDPGGWYVSANGRSIGSIGA